MPDSKQSVQREWNYRAAQLIYMVKYCRLCGFSYLNQHVQTQNRLIS